MERSFVTILMFVLVLLFQSCSEPKAVGGLLQKAEAYMEEQPKHSLEMLEAVNKDDLTTRKVQAKYALLYSMALDKNYIDIADDSIIAPAVNYYKNHGSADEKLMTYYYAGRILMNADNYEDAMHQFILAEPYVNEAHNKNVAARLYKAQMLIYQYSYDSDMMIHTAEESADYHLMAGDTTKYINTLNDVVTGYLHKQDTVNSRIYLEQIKSYWNILSPRQISNWYSAMLLLNEYTREFEAETMISKYLTTVSEPFDIRWLSVANAYYYSGNLQKAKEALEYAALYERSDSMFSHLMAGHIYTDLGDYCQATHHYRQYIASTGKKNGRLFESDINFMKERHESQMQLLRRNYTISILVLCALTLALAVIVIVFKMRWIRKERQLSDEKHRVDIELAEQRQHAERLQHAEEMKRLESEKNNYIKMYDETLAEIERLKNALKDNELDMSVRAHVTERLTLLNKFVAANIVPSFSNEAAEELKHLMDDKRYFIESTRLSFSLAYPQFVKCLQKFGLADNEIGFCCLYTIGLRGKDVANYMGMSSSWYYKFSSNLRKKFDLEEKDTNIDIYLRNLFEKTAR